MPRRSLPYRAAAVTLSDRIFEELTKDILSGALEPGQRLDEPTLCRKFDVSRTPTREALRRLSGTGLVEAAPRKGVTVARIDIRQLTDMIEALAEFEGLCARLSAVRMTDLEKKRLELVNITGQQRIHNGEQDFATINAEFHELVYQGSHSNSIAAVTRSFRQRLTPFRPLQFVRGYTESAFSEHDGVVRAILAADPDAAYRVMRDHVTNLGLRIIEHFTKRLAMPPAEKHDSAASQRGLTAARVG